jgi:TPR repeat protein
LNPPASTALRWALRVAACYVLATPTLVAAAPAASPTYEQEITAFSIEAPRVQAMLEHAIAAEIGHGQARSPLRAAMLYCDAAREGSAEAYYRLGRLYLTGNGIEKSLPMAATVFSIAAQNGHHRAHDALELTGMRDEQIPLCITDPETAWAAIGQSGHIDIERYAERLSKERATIAAFIRKQAPGFDLDPRFALAIAAVESNFNALARSPKDAMGVMQLIPATAERFGVKNPMHPEQNVRGGLAYLKWLFKRFAGDLKLVAAAYNAGEGAVDRYKGIPPYAETQAYVRRVMQFMPPPTLHEVRKSVRDGLP